MPSFGDDPRSATRQAPVTAATFAKGEILAGKFRIEKDLGRGGMGHVFAAKHVTLGHLVAIKVMSSAPSWSNVPVHQKATIPLAQPAPRVPAAAVSPRKPLSRVFWWAAPIVLLVASALGAGIAFYLYR